MNESYLFFPLVHFHVIPVRPHSAASPLGLLSTPLCYQRNDPKQQWNCLSWFGEYDYASWWGRHPRSLMRANLSRSLFTMSSFCHSFSTFPCKFLLCTTLFFYIIFLLIFSSLVLSFLISCFIIENLIPFFIKLHQLGSAWSENIIII